MVNKDDIGLIAFFVSLVLSFAVSLSFYLCTRNTIGETISSVISTLIMIGAVVYLFPLIDDKLSKKYKVKG